jgi:hypothetical protein
VLHDNRQLGGSFTASLRGRRIWYWKSVHITQTLHESETYIESVACFSLNTLYQASMRDTERWFIM